MNLLKSTAAEKTEALKGLDHARLGETGALLADTKPADPGGETAVDGGETSGEVSRE